jgi:hypothetical protein
MNMTTAKAKETCTAVASASGERCKRTATTDGYCRQHYVQIHPEAAKELKAPKLTDVDDRNHVVAMGVEDATTAAISSSPEFQKFEIAKRIAHVLANSNLVPDAYRGRPNDCFIAISMGAELGMKPFQAIQSITVIDSKPCLYGDGLIGVVRASPICEWIEESVADDGKSAACTTQRRGDRSPISRTYTMADATLAGVTGKFNWQKHPKRMLQMRARSFCLRDAYPDLLKGLGVVEEMQDHDNTPPVVTSYSLPEPPSNAASAPDRPEVTLASVERAIHQSDTMADLLKAAELAKNLNTADQTTARLVYKKHRDLIMSDTHVE